MRPSQALNMRRVAIQHVVESYPVVNLRVFGSASRGEDREGSDLDLLVDPLPGATLLDLGGLQVDLENLLGVEVDLVTPGDLPIRFRARVLDEAIPV